MKVNEIYNESCMDTMAKMADNFVDCVITSPPYNTARTGSNERAFDNYENRYDIHLDNKTDVEYIEWSVDLFKAYARVLKPNGSILYNISYSSENTDLIWKVVFEVIKSTVFTVADTIIWKKNCAIPNNTSPNKLTRICEFVFVFARKEELNTFFMNKEITTTSHTGQNFYENKFNFIEAPNNDESNELNKATFSTKLVRSLLQLYTGPENVIYDSFMGTGTTAKGCLIEGRKFIGSELSDKQVQYANKRLKPFLTQTQLF